MMKKKIKISILLLCLILLILTMYHFFNKKVSTDLSDLKINDLLLGQNIDTVGNAAHTVEDGWNYSEGNIRIKTDEKGNIIKMLIYQEDANEIIYKGQLINKDIENIKMVLGDGYKCKSYDYNQGLKKIIYNDVENKVQFEVIYYSTDKGNEINWFILSTM
jgi:hypothetical protein